MGERELREILCLSESIADYFFGDYWGADEYRVPYEDARPQMIFKFELKALTRDLYENDIGKSEALPEDFFYDLMTAYAHRYGFRTIGHNHADTWEDIGKHLALKAITRSSDYQRLQPASKENNNIRKEALRRKMLFSHLQNIVPSLLNYGGFSLNKATYDLLVKKSHSTSTGSIVMKPKLPDESLLQVALSKYWETFTELERFEWYKVNSSMKIYHAIELAFDYARLDKSWETVRQSFQR